MIYNLIGYYSLVIGLIIGLSLFYFSYKNFNNSNILDTKILSFTFLQLFLVLISFLALIISFVISDFSNETVFNNSHTTKPLFYKIAGTWGNHEGSLLLWLLVLTLFIFVFILKTNNQPIKIKQENNEMRVLGCLDPWVPISWGPLPPRPPKGWALGFPIYEV